MSKERTPMIFKLITLAAAFIVLPSLFMVMMHITAGMRGAESTPEEALNFLKWGIALIVGIAIYIGNRVAMWLMLD